MYNEIVIPRTISEAAEQLARAMEISISELYTAALSTYITTYQEDNLTELLNQIYSTEPSALEHEIIKMQCASIEDETW